MDDKTRLEMEALITEREGMIAENIYQTYHHCTVTYKKDAFIQHANKFRALAKEPKCNCNYYREYLRVNHPSQFLKIAHICTIHDKQEELKCKCNCPHHKQSLTQSWDCPVHGNMEIYRPWEGK